MKDHHHTVMLEQLVSSKGLNNFHNQSTNVTLTAPRSVQQSSIAPAAFTALSTLSTLTILYLLSSNKKDKESSRSGSRGKGYPDGSSSRSTPLPGYGILGDRVNEFIELFLDALAVYVNNDRDCQRRMLCEANQRASDYGLFQGVIMYFLSLGVSLFLQNQRVSESLEAMKFGRHGNDCTSLYSRCPYSL